MALLERVVTDPEDGTRADVAVARWLDEPRARAQERFAAGEVTCDRQPIPKSYRLRPGERVVVATPSPPAAPPPPPPVAVRYEDAHLAVVAKPAGLVVHAGAGHADATLVDALRAMGMPLADTGDEARPGIVHRLDRGTSGVLAVAKDAAARDGLRARFAAHEVERVYWALVEGHPDPPRATIDSPILRDPRRRTRFTVAAGGRPAVSHYTVSTRLRGVAELAVRLGTGRTHQVRVHLSAVGHPVCGDHAYGASPALAAELSLDRPALHARRLAFLHPVTGARVDVEEPLPVELSRARARAAGLPRFAVADDASPITPEMVREANEDS